MDYLFGGCKSENQARSILLAPDESIELVFEHSPAAADFLSPDFTVVYIFEISWAGNFKIKAGLLGIKKYAVVAGLLVAIRPPIKAVAPTVRCFTALIAPATHQFTFISHECDLVDWKKIAKRTFYIIGI